MNPSGERGTSDIRGFVQQSPFHPQTHCFRKMPNTPRRVAFRSVRSKNVENKVKLWQVFWEETVILKGKFMLKSKLMTTVFGAATLVMAGLATGASAATLNLSSAADDFSALGLSVSTTGTYENGMPGNRCPGPNNGATDAPCVVLDDLETLTISALPGYLFDLTNFYYRFITDAGANSFTGSFTADPAIPDLIVLRANDAEQQATGDYLNLSSVTFTANFLNNGRDPERVFLDYFTVESRMVSPVPVPAAGLLLVGAIGGLAALRRRRKA